MKIETGTVELTMEFTHPVAAVFAAWSQEQAQRTWGDPGDGWHLAFDRFRFEVGESDLCRFGPDGGAEYVNENRYLAIEDGRRIVYATSLRCGDALTFAGTVAVAFEQAGGGTRMRFIEHGLYFDGHDDVDSHRAGWEGMFGAMAAWLDGAAVESRTR